MRLSREPWWLTDDYAADEPTPAEFHALAGPHGVATVAVWGEGRTQPGWGLAGPGGSAGFMARYQKGEFNERKTAHAYRAREQPFAFVMRSVKLLCVDIDGKNGGLERAKRLGLLPPTLAETSKSGSGLHLFYAHDGAWDAERGFDAYADYIGIEQGVDIRAVGCVYHYPTQRWNRREVAPLPLFLAELFEARRQRQLHKAQYITKVLETDDEMEIIMMHDQLLSELAKPIPAGKRNTTLFAIGSQMSEAGVPGWGDLVLQRALQVGLDQDEAVKIVENIGRYAPALP